MVQPWYVWYNHGSLGTTTVQLWYNLGTFGTSRFLLDKTKLETGDILSKIDILTKLNLTPKA